MPSIAVVGASSDRNKYGNKCVRAYLKHGWTVYPINPKEPRIEGLTAFPSLAVLPGPIDRVAFYVPPEVGIGLLGDVARADPKELYLNPGTESDALLAEAGESGLPYKTACAIVAIGETPSNFP